jgi:hypothetical protein
MIWVYHRAYRGGSGLRSMYIRGLTRPINIEQAKGCVIFPRADLSFLKNISLTLVSLGKKMGH